MKYYKSEPVTNPNYWDCECREKFIHRREQDYCPRCGAWREDQPDSRVNEIVIKDCHWPEQIGAPDTDEHGRVKVTLEDRSIEYVSMEDLEAAGDFFDNISQ